MSLHDEKAAALAEVLAATGEEIIWKGHTFHALVSDSPLSRDLGLGGFSAKGDRTMKVLRSELGGDRPKLGETLEFQEATFLAGTAEFGTFQVYGSLGAPAAAFTGSETGGALVFYDEEGNQKSTLP